LVFDPRFPNQELNPLLLIVLCLFPGLSVWRESFYSSPMGCLHPLMCFCLELFVALVITNENNLKTTLLPIWKRLQTKLDKDPLNQNRDLLNNELPRVSSFGI
jgi:hypothetical protein